jgi:hypothetical protein
MLRNRRLASRRCIASLLIGAIAVTGCVKTREYKVARYVPHAEPLTQAIPRDGWYKVKWKVRDEYEGIDHTRRYLTKGTTVGFQTSSEGNVVAIVGEARIFVGDPNPKAKYCCWYLRSKEPTQFAKEVREALAATGEVAQVIVIGGVVGAAAGVGFAEALKSDDDDEDR